MASLLAIFEDVITTGFGAKTLSAIHALDPSHDARARDRDAVASAEDVERLLSSLAIVRESTAEQMYRWIAEASAVPLLRKVPEILRAYPSIRPLLLDMNGIPATKMHALLPDAHLPYFDIEITSADITRISFTGSVEARAALEGLLVGYAKTIDEFAEVTRVSNHNRPERQILEVKMQLARKVTPRGGIAPSAGRESPSRGR